MNTSTKLKDIPFVYGDVSGVLIYGEKASYITRVDILPGEPVRYECFVYSNRIHEEWDQTIAEFCDINNIVIYGFLPIDLNLVGIEHDEHIHQIHLYDNVIEINYLDRNETIVIEDINNDL